MFEILRRVAIRIKNKKEQLVAVQYSCPIHGIVGDGPHDFFRLSRKGPERCGRCLEELINKTVPELTRTEISLQQET